MCLNPLASGSLCTPGLILFTWIQRPWLWSLAETKQWPQAGGKPASISSCATTPVPASAVRKPPRQTHQTFRHQNRYPQTVPRNSQSAPSKTFVGDQHQCGVGSCEFFLFCWLGGGIIEGNCGGFLFSCCLRPDGGGENSKILASKVSFFWTNDSPSTSMFLSYQTNLFIQKIILFSKIL